MTDIGLAKKQRVFAVMETTKGTLVFPAASNLIRPAGDAVLNQTPVFNNSEEKQDTLDVLDLFQGAMPAGDFTVPTYLRPSTTVGGVPQADALWKSLMGTLNAATTGSLDGALTAGTVTIKVDNLAGGILPEKGVITVSAEKFYYDGITRVSRTATSATLTGVVRSFAGTTAATPIDNSNISLTSRFYRQSTAASSFSLWVETDHFVQGLSGCSVNQAALSINNDGPVKVNFTGQGMQMVWAGTDSPTHTHALGTDTIRVNDAKRFSVGAYIYNDTKDDTNGDAGYEITAVDFSSASHSITLATITDEEWTYGDSIRGYLPIASVIGTPLEGGDTAIRINGIAATIKPSELTINAPKKYVTDEIGIEYPQDYIEDTRNITAAFNLYFRKETAKYFTDGYAGSEVTALLTLDDDDEEHRVDVYLKRCKLTVPTVTFAAPAVELYMTLTALGTVGEDSCEICFN